MKFVAAHSSQSWTRYLKRDSKRKQIFFPSKPKKEEKKTNFGKGGHTKTRDCLISTLYTEYYTPRTKLEALNLYMELCLSDI